MRIDFSEPTTLPFFDLGWRIDDADSIADRVHKYAVDAGYGYKTSNLMVLRDIAREIEPSLRFCKVDVPAFLPLSDDDIHEHLRATFPTLDHEWSLFIRELRSSGGHLTEAGRQRLERIQSNVRSAFTDHVYTSEYLKAWLLETREPFLIVRSTGREDSDQISNAGGNLSVPCVLPQAAALSKAIGEVVASYFGERSIGQRLAANDATLLTEPPFLPVLIQDMIGERPGIARSGVLFTSQQGRAEGVTLIQAGLGHNEGIVSCRVAVDSYYVDAGLNVDQVIREKPLRMKQQGTELVSTSTPLEMRMLPALTPEMVRDLQYIASEVEHIYGDKPMDIEFTIDPSTKTIYLLQARPLVAPEGNARPTYADLAGGAPANIVHGVTLVDGTPRVRVLSSVEEILFSSDLPKALQTFLKSDRQDSIKAVVIRKTAPSTSHEAVVLRAKGIAVLVIEDAAEYSRLQQWGSDPVLVDPQQACIVKGKSNQIRPGFIRYPIALELSLPPLVKHTDASLQALHNRFKLFAGAKNSDAEKMTTRELFHAMASKPTTGAEAALRTLIRRLHACLHANMKDAQGFRADINQELFRAFSTALDKAEGQVLPALQAYPPLSANRLYALHFLEALVFQAGSGGIVDGHSFQSVLGVDHAERTAIEADSAGFKGPHAAILLQLARVGDLALNEDSRKKWSQFIHDIEKQCPKQLPKLAGLVVVLQKLGLTLPWLNVVFPESANDHTSPILRLRTLIDQLKKERPLLKWMHHSRKTLKTIEDSVDEWSNPSYVTEHLGDIRKLLRDHLGFEGENSTFKNLYMKVGKLGQLALLQLLGETVDVYDRIIKSITGSTEFKDIEEKASAFAIALIPYDKMCETTLSLVSPELEQRLMSVDYVDSPLYSFAEYLERLRGGSYYDDEPGFESKKLQAIQHSLDEPEKEFEARSSFVVDHLVVGSRSDLNYYVQWPRRLEEFFTTFHQNCEQVRRILQTGLGFNRKVLSAETTKVLGYFEDAFKKRISEIFLEGSKLTIVFQLPLRQHSCRLALEMDIHHPEKGYDLDLRAFGCDEHFRWDQIAALGALWGSGYPYPYKLEAPPKIDYDQPGSVAWRLHIPQGFPEVESFADVLNWALYSMSMDSWYADEVGKVVEGMNEGFSWSKVGEPFYKYGFNLGRVAILRLMDEGKKSAALRAAKNFLLGLAEYGLSDFIRAGDVTSYSPEAVRYLGGDWLSWGGTNSMKALMLEWMIYFDEENVPGIAAAVNELVNNPAMQRYMPDAVDALRDM